MIIKQRREKAFFLLQVAQKVFTKSHEDVFYFGYITSPVHVSNFFLYHQSTHFRGRFSYFVDRYNSV
jgi:hypothetical protein